VHSPEIQAGLRRDGKGQSDRASRQSYTKDQGYPGQEGIRRRPDKHLNPISQVFIDWQADPNLRIFFAHFLFLKKD